MLPPLPADSLLPGLLAALERGGNAVVVAPPGAGKTTRVPPALALAPFLAGGRSPGRPCAVAVLQPRRVAARGVAARIAEERGWRLGGEVGYQVRFDNRTGPATVVRVMTEGILARRIQSDPFLEDIGCVVLDEFHERSIHTDLALALLREIQTTVREDLRLVVMSATLDPGPVARFLGDAPVFESPGRLFPVALDYLDRKSTAPCWELAAEAVRCNAGRDRPGHVLVFLPGMGEIRRTASLLEGIDADLHLLHSSVSPEAQDRALRPSGRRKIVLATNIAETSLTIDGVTTVVDTGLARVLVSDSRLGIDRLDLRRISRASADQRSGRAGRTAPGRCLRLWSLSEDAALDDALPPEIQRIDLASTLLTLRAYGVRDPAAFAWFEKPRPEALAGAERLLEMLGATVAGAALTPLGRRLAALPLHPRLGRLLLAGAEHGLAREAATLAALLSERDILSSLPGGRRRSADWEGDSDLVERLELVEEGTGERMPDPPQALRTVRHLRDDLLRMVQKGAAPPADRETELRRVLLHAYPDRVTLRPSNDPTRGVLVGGRGVVLEPSSVVRRGELFLSLDPRDPSGGRDYRPAAGESRVGLASAIEERWLGEVFPHLLGQRLVHRFDPDRGRVLSARQIVFAGLVLHEDFTGAGGDLAGAGAALADWLAKDGAGFFEADEASAGWLARLRFLQRHLPELEWPALDADALEEVLRAACAGCTTIEQVRARGLRGMLAERLPWALRPVLQDEAPEALEVPSGSRIRLQYPPGGANPVLAVRLQELFGLPRTPRVARGRVPVVLHLLAPNQRPVQITLDLENFWNSTYQEVRRELRARYPKHPWPEDPWNAPAVSVGRRPRRDG